MMIAVLGVLFALVAVLGTAVPAAIVEVRQGREGFLAVAGRAATRAGLADSLGGTWTIAAQAAAIGAASPLPPITTRAGLVVSREALRLTATVWLVAAETSIRDRGGASIAASTEGLLVQLALVPGDTVPRPVRMSRAWVAAFQ